MLYVIGNAILEAIRCLLVAGITEFAHIGFGKILIRVADVFRRIDEANVWFFTHGMEGVGGQVVEGAGLAGTNIVQPIRRLMGIKEVEHVNHIFYVDKVAALLAVFYVRAVRAE